MEIEDVILKVVNTLKVYEKGFTSVKRNPVDYQKRVESLSEFVECRVNFELFKDSKFKELEEIMDSHLFEVESINDENSFKNSFSSITLSIGNKPINMSEEDYRNVTESLIDLIGGTSISFSSDRNNLNLVIR